MAAAVIGQDTPLNSLQLALDYDFVVGSCENGYSCVYQRTFSWKTPTTPMPMESNPRAVFERMFGEGGTAAERFARMRQDRSILDLAIEDMARLRRRLGVRRPRRRSTSTSPPFATSSSAFSAPRTPDADLRDRPSVEQPVGIPDQFDDHAKLMLDLNLLAFQADVTRVVAFQISRELSGRPYPWIGVPDGHHSVSHHQLDPEKITKATKINAYHVSLFGYLLEKMKNTPDGDGTLLDHSIMMYGTGMGDSDHHTPVNLPVDPGRRRLRPAQGRTSPRLPGQHADDESRPDAPRQGRAAQGQIADSTGRLTDL